MTNNPLKDPDRAPACACWACTIGSIRDWSRVRYMDEDRKSFPWLSLVCHGSRQTDKVGRRCTSANTWELTGA